jgi:mono/diheme cytochrome c family protein
MNRSRQKIFQREQKGIVSYMFLTVIILLTGIFLSTCGDNPDRKFFPDMEDSLAVETQETDSLSHPGWNKRISGIHPSAEGTLPKNFIRYPFRKAKDDQKAAGEYLVNPFPMARNVLERGEKLFQVFCEPCHGARGNSERSIAFFPGVRDLTDTFSIALNDGEIFHAITNGGIQMSGHEAQIEPEERWTIVNYIRLLQVHAQYKAGEKAKP